MSVVWSSAGARNVVRPALLRLSRATSAIVLLGGMLQAPLAGRTSRY
ncbi:MAG: hypothetical protein ACYC3X_24355 [Pirellulaceae bacterium]